MKRRGYMSMGDLNLIPQPTQTRTPISMPPPVNSDILAEARVEAENISKVVSPWLWVLSLISFGTAMFINTPRINAMWNKLNMTKFKGLKKPRV